MHGEAYINKVTETINKAWFSQQEQLMRTAEMMAETIKRKSSVFVFGCSHAGILAEEVFYRTGGLAIMNPIFFSGVTLSTRPVTMTSDLERMSGLGKIILENNNVKSGDMLFIHSNSGRNTVPVEMAIEAHKKGVFVVGFTSLQHSNSVTSRHPSGKRLFEVCDIVIDNCGIPGDASIKLDGLEEMIGPTSTAVGTSLINGIVIETVERLIADGIVPPVFMSANLDGGDEHNRKIFEEYADNIFYM